MGRVVNIPVRVVRTTEKQAAPAVPEGNVQPADPGALNNESTTQTEPEVEAPEVIAAAEPVEQRATPEAQPRDELEEWRDRALRLQAEMASYRRRQQRLAQDQIEVERQRLLGAFIKVVDDLERALAVPADGKDGLRQGLELTHRAAVQLLEREGVEPVEAEKQPFDPNWHEAVATVGRNGGNAVPGTIVRVMEPGYRLGDRLLRPAKVVVAV
jgi:molecular chaperone GrpE